MNDEIGIRPENQGDVDIIAQITEEAFRNHPISRNTEQFIIRELRSSGALSLSLVAEYQGEVVGHICFSRVEISDGSPDWYTLGPVSVKPAFQGRGIGQSLVRAGLAELRELGGQGCVLAGDPAFYGRFGFISRPDCTMPGVPQEFFLSLTLGRKEAAGRVVVPAAFGATS